MKIDLNTPNGDNRATTYHTLESLHLPHNRVGQMVRIGFADDGTFVDVQFFDATELIGHLRWECGVSDESIERRFARLYIAVCREIPPYCARDIRTLYAAVKLIMQVDVF